MMRIPAFLLLIFLTVPAPASQPFSSEGRLAYLGETLAELNTMKASERRDVKEAVAAAGRGKCQSFNDTATLFCLQKEAKAACASGPLKSRSGCMEVWDVAIVNRMNEKEFISTDEKFRISEKAANFSEAFDKKLLSKYALLVTQMALGTKTDCSEKDVSCLAGEIDHYCLDYAGVQNLPWQACASAILWFMASRQR